MQRFSHLHIATLLQLICGALLLFAPEAQSSAQSAGPEFIRETLNKVSTFSSRAIGSEGVESAARLIEDHFISLGLKPESHNFEITSRQSRGATINFKGVTHPLHPFPNNAITPGATGEKDGTLEGPLYYVGKGSLEELNGKDIAGAIVLMEFNSSRNWQTLASLGARALIFIDREATRASFYFWEKQELSPLQFPCFWLDEGMTETIFGNSLPGQADGGKIADSVTLTADIAWKNGITRNIYAVINGSDEDLQDELLIIEAFYDTPEFVTGRAPGADAALSLATLLYLAEELVENPPARSVLLVATSGHAQSLAGMREMIWSLDTRSRELRNTRRELEKDIKTLEEQSALLRSLEFPLGEDKERDKVLAQIINKHLKYQIDTISRDLMQLRLAGDREKYRSEIATQATTRFALRQLSWAETFHDLDTGGEETLQSIIPDALSDNQELLSQLNIQYQNLISATRFRQTVRGFDIAAVVSLHLSSHGSGVGGFHRGWLYKLKPTINRTGIYSTIADVLKEAGEASPASYNYYDTLRPGRLRPWDSWFLDNPQLGGEVSSLAGFIGISLVTVGDGRLSWGTPWDTVDKVDLTNGSNQAALVADLVYGLARAPTLNSGRLPRDGLADATARTNLLLQGELFADFPAAGTTILAYQGLNRFYATVDGRGQFQIRGLADKKNVFDKLIIEGYKFDPKSGSVIWAIDKNTTGKNNYRLKMLRKSMRTDLVMFNSRETTFFDLLEPRNFQYMTKLQLYDGRRDAPPQHFWYSRIDTRKSNIASIYLEPGALLKMTLSDTILTTKMILTNGTEDRPLGLGYPVNDYSKLPNTTLHAAHDAWSLLQPRIRNLESHGIFDEKINGLEQRGIEALKTSQNGFAALNYSIGREKASESLAIASRVYSQIEKSQKDVLFGVLFYIALFIPFAFCMERFLFNFNNIYKRILGFSGILIVLIAIIYQVHPAFQLTYSPLVVILAFFIIGLSLMVTLIIFFRFEKEMALLQQRSTHKRPDEISRWKAFVAAFFLGVSNLRRRRLRTILTCTTLIILTFTIMSFTTIKSNREENRLQLQPQAPYQGLLLKKLNWASLPPQATDILVNSMKSIEQPATRVWLEAGNPSQTIHAPLVRDGRDASIQGLIGLTAQEPSVTGLDYILTSGRWFTDDDNSVILLEDDTARRLGIDPSVMRDKLTYKVKLWGADFTVVGTFSAEKLEKAIDLNGEPLTPVTFPQEAGATTTETEQEALESGEDIRLFQSRYTHIPASQVAIIPANSLLAAGGSLKSIAVKPESGEAIDKLAKELSDRFSLAIFTGENDGVFLYNVSDTINYSGVPNIIVPLLISVLIVLNTMISSVYERKNEIAIYTSVGLAPSHVAFLFVAEAIALAVISVVLGYVIAQVSAFLLSHTTLWQGITVNYSSLAGVAAMALVILVVLVSVIYPAKVASRIAIPDVERTFTLPQPVNNTISVTLPFLMKYHEHESIGGFIHEYFTGHQDISHGIFSTGPVDVIFSCSTLDELRQMVDNSSKPSELLCLHLRANVWLAPFDFGIMQLVDVQFCPAQEGREYLSIKVTLKRKSGEAQIWRRINTVFLNDLRKQLLVWRSLTPEEHADLAAAFQLVSAGKESGTEGAHITMETA
ncbi:FtsX-like permease family protein [Desulfosediminicola ganghwensis]|uniref:FtsX-like permease family protein n=1 Tax=Desulfosediminicola ganghwensis TaxID=2569540 RepID=UPI0010AC5F9C|nr:FtsX-like permease family protein [Desulfosediminicola ganghwensis]